MLVSISKAKLLQENLHTHTRACAIRFRESQHAAATTHSRIGSMDIFSARNLIDCINLSHKATYDYPHIT